ncbi:MAG: hypothetical protein EOM12_04460 [Verrucomicrobiae bacterium]|nr:hypothetical protein [Verrucomicrobiae bacterium]
MSIHIQSSADEFGAEHVATAQRKKVRLIVLLIALLGTGAMGWNTLSRIERAVEGSPDACDMPDTQLYREGAQAIINGVPLPPAIQDRMLLPLLLAGAGKMNVSEFWFLLFPILLMFPVVVSVAYLARIFSEKTNTAPVVAAIITVLLPSFYSYGPELGTDVLHAQLAIIAFSATVAWVESAKKKWVILAMGLWPLVQLTRQNFFFLAPLAIIVLWPTFFKENRLWSIGLIMVMLLVPVKCLYTNYSLYGVCNFSLNAPEVLLRITGAKMKAHALNRENPGSLAYYYEHVRGKVVNEDEDWRALNLYDTASINRESFKKHYQSAVHRAKQFILDNKRDFLATSLSGVFVQLLVPPQYAARSTVSLTQSRVLRPIHKVALYFMVLGLLMLLLTKTRYAVFLLLVLFQFGSCLVLYWAMGISARLPYELLLIPVMTVEMLKIRAWVGLSFICIFGYLPKRMLDFSEWWLLTVAVFVISALLYAFIVHLRKEKKDT